MKNLNMRSWCGFTLLALLLFLFLYNFSIMQKERFLQQEDSLILALAPVDPRSLMQGDYMVLRFAMENELERAWTGEDWLPRKGRVVVIEQDGEHVFRRHYTGESLEPGERLLEYTFENRRLKIGGGAFFFEEGLARLYEYARYATVSADAGGKAIINGLLDANKRPLNKKRWNAEQRRLIED